MITIGLDLSINSTGICVNDDGEYHYYIITSKRTRKLNKFTNDHINIIFYDKKETDSENIREIGVLIQQIILSELMFLPDLVIMEDVAMGARSRSIITLTLLNGYVRRILDEMEIKYITATPTQWKKQMLGNGQADKELTVYHWKKLQPQYSDLEIKVDDIADAYFLSNMKI